MKPEPEADRAELRRNLIIFWSALPVAVVTWAIFHAIYTNLTITAAAVGEIDPGTKMGVAFGYIAMIGGTGVFAAIALVAGIRALRIARRLRHAPKP